MKELFRTLVGSRLYGLHTEDSDHDYRAVHMTPLGDVLLGTGGDKNTHTQDDEGNDVTSYELRHFVKLVMGGNPTMMEMLFSLRLSGRHKLFSYFKPLLDEENMNTSWRGYTKGALSAFRKEPYTQKSLKHLSGVLTYGFVNSSVLADSEDFMRDGLPPTRELAQRCREGDTMIVKEVLKRYENWPEGSLMPFKKKADMRYAQNLLLDLYTGLGALPES